MAIDLAAHQLSMGDDASVVLLSSGQAAQKACQAIGLAVQDCGTGPLRILRARQAMKHADVLHLHMPSPWLGPVLPSSPRKVMHLHVRPSSLVHPPSWRVKLDSLGGREILKRVDRTIAITQWVADAWRSEFAGVLPPVSVVHNGIKLGQQFVPRANDPFTIGIASRLSPKKGVEEFIALASELHKRAPDIHFRVAGEGPQKEQFEQLTDASGLSKVMQFEGFVSDMAAFWSRAHLCAFTPPFEPFGLRLIEPLGHGVPVVAYLNGSGSDEVVSMCRGIEAVNYQETARLADLVLSLKDNPKKLSLMAEHGRKDVVEHFSIDLMAQRVAQAYEAQER